MMSPALPHLDQASPSVSVTAEAALRSGGPGHRDAARPATAIWPGADAAQVDWARTPIARRLDVVRSLRADLADDPERWASLVGRPDRTQADTLSAEVLPLIEACRFLQRRAARVLADHRHGLAGRPAWLWGVRLTVRREPLGRVLILAPSNYPLLLPGVQIMQALVAGNAVAVKPAPGCSAPMVALAEALADAGLPRGLLHVLDEDPAAAQAWIDAGVQRVLLTGSRRTGLTVARRLADDLIPATMELSGCDACFILPGADLSLAARSIVFGLTLNAGETCIAPRRIYCPRSLAPVLEAELTRQLAQAASRPLRPAEPAAHRARALIESAVRDGARSLAPVPSGRDDGFVPTVVCDMPDDHPITRSDLFAPVACLIAVDSTEHALRLDAENPWGLGASVFGPRGEAERLAKLVRAGTVTVNDLIVPTADPRLPFAARGASGYGVTRGAEGLLELTQPKAIAVRTGGPRPHLDAPSDSLAALLGGLIRLLHARGLTRRLSGLRQMVAAAGRIRVERKNSPAAAREAARSPHAPTPDKPESGASS